MSVCAPSIKSKKTTCFTYDQLKSIAMKYNKTHPKNTIKLHKSKQLLFDAINEKMSNECDTKNEVCWVKNDIDLLEKVFIPTKPLSWRNNPREWLSNIDIEDVLSQYENKYTSFKFIGVFPSNFDYKINDNTCVAKELCTINIDDLLKHKKKQLAIVFNTDPHYLSGSHWISVYINISKNSKKYGYYFYDSAGSQPFDYIKRLFLSIKKQLNDQNFKMHFNDVKHQKGDSECGMFTINFLLNMLNNKMTFKKFIKENPTDKYVYQLRNVLFRK